MSKVPQKPELIFGVIAKIGTDIDVVNTLLAEELGQYGYNTTPIKLTDALTEAGISTKLSRAPLKEPIEARYSSTMDACNELRNKLGNEIMAEIAVTQISAARVQISKKTSEKSTPHAFVIRQLKRKEEVNLLRHVYGERFVLLSCYSPRETRCNVLAQTIADGHHSSEPNKYRAKAEELIARDENEIDNDGGQRVRDAFPLADVIIDASDKQTAQKTMTCFLEVFFGNPKIAPTKDEYGSYMASSASLRSTDLSRQVGAAIFTKNLEVISLGSNEVPKFSGGTYLQDQAMETGLDGRDAAIGYDENARMKSEIVKDALYRVNQLNGEALTTTDIDTILEKHLYSDTGILKDLLIMDLTEFGRAVHAEMNAITDAARMGRSTKGTVLYCTTFPCHNCAKHIVASGIERVVYIQPYPKSKASRLYPDSIIIDPKHESGEKVLFETHKGVAPNLYKRVFGKTKKKDKLGNLLPWNKLTSLPSVNIRDVGYQENEKATLKVFQGKISSS